MLYCTGAWLAVIDWFCGIYPISSATMPVTTYGGGKFLGIRLCLAPAQNPTPKYG